MDQFRQNNFNQSVSKHKRDKSDAKITWAVALPLIAACIFITYRAFGG